MFFEEYDLYVSGDGGYHECRIPALLTTSKGTILAFNEARKFTGRDSDQIDLFLRRSFDGGKSFDEVQVVATEEDWVCGNPAPVQDRETGTIWLPFCKNLRDGKQSMICAGKAQRTVWITHSDDDGETWSEPDEITSSVKMPDWSWYATGPGHAIQLQSGRMVVACDHTVMKHRDQWKDADHSHIIYSDDHGASWKIGGSADMGTNESTALETDDGWLYINCRNQYFPKQKGLSHFRQVAWSNDDGESFSPVVHDAGLPEPICEGSVCRYTLEKDDPQGREKNRVLFSNPGSEKEGERHHLTIRLSYDECRTWPVSKVIYEGPSSYSDLCIANDGTICCLYEKGQEKGVSTYSGDITLARFDLEWLTDGEDSLQ
jgi:sialidase-1